MNFLQLDPWQLIALSAVFGALSGANALIKTLVLRTRAGYVDMTLIFLAVLPAVAAVVRTYSTDAPDALVGTYALLLAGAVGAAHGLTALLELLRKPRWNGSRGLLGVFAAVFLAVASLGVPIGWAFTALEADPAEPTPATVAQAAETTAEAAATPDAEERFANLFRSILKSGADATGLDELAIIDQLEGGTTFAKVVTDNGGDLEVVIDEIAAIMRTTLREFAAEGAINPIQAALALSQMETFIRFMVNSDITQLGDRLGAATPEPNATPRSLRALYETPAAPAASPASAVALAPTLAPTSTLAPTATPTAARLATNTAIPAPTATRTPAAASATPTRFTFSTRTPLPTATPVTPCLASVEFNLRLRARPETASDTLTVIPFGTAIELFGRGPDSDSPVPDEFWWQTEWEGQRGWVDGQFMIVSRACASLPLLPG